ncbi:hypothetical protein ACLMAB_20095 [Brevibacillus laterosporus]
METKKGLDWLAALFLFFLLREWLLPLPSLSDTGSISCFLYLVAGIILVDMIFRSHWMGLLMKGILAIVIFHAAFVEISFLILSGFRKHGEQLVKTLLRYLIKIGQI